MLNRKQTISFVVGAILAVTLLTSCGQKQTNVQASSPSGRGDRGAAAPAPVLVSNVTTQDIPLEITAIGNVEAYQTVLVKSMVGGQIEGVHFREGEDIHKGQLLFTLDKRPFQAALDQATANLSRDKAQSAQSQLQAKRYSDLEKQGVISKDQAEQLISQAQSQIASVAADQAAVEAAKVQLQYAEIYAPIEARTGALQINQGNLVRPNDTAFLVQLNQITPIYVTFSVPETRLSQIRGYNGRGLKVLAYPKGQTTGPSVGSLTFIDNGVDPQTATVRLKATFENKDRRLWPGEFTDVVLQLSTQKDVTVVPTKAVQSGQMGDFVYVVTQDKIAIPRPVTTGGSYRDLTIISQGVTSGESVIVEGHVRVIPNGKVAVQAPRAAGVDSPPSTGTQGVGQ